MNEYRTVEHRDNGCIVRVHIPCLTEEEKSKREKEIESALIRFEKERRMNDEMFKEVLGVSYSFDGSGIADRLAKTRKSDKV